MGNADPTVHRRAKAASAASRADAAAVLGTAPRAHFGSAGHRSGVQRRQSAGPRPGRAVKGSALAALAGIAGWRPGCTRRFGHAGGLRAARSAGPADVAQAPTPWAPEGWVRQPQPCHGVCEAAAAPVSCTWARRGPSAQLSNVPCGGWTSWGGAEGGTAAAPTDRRRRRIDRAGGRQCQELRIRQARRGWSRRSVARRMPGSKFALNIADGRGGGRSWRKAAWLKPARHRQGWRIWSRRTGQTKRTRIVVHRFINLEHLLHGACRCLRRRWPAPW